MGKIIGISLIVVISLFLIEKKLVKIYSDKLVNSLMEDSSQFLKMVDSTMVKILIKPFNREYMRLNYYMGTASKKNVFSQIEKMEKMNLGKKQKEFLYQTSFQYFVAQEDELSADQIQKKWNSYVDQYQLSPKLKEALEMEMKIYFHKDIDSISYIDERISTCSENEKSSWYYKKSSVLYANHHNKEAKENLLLAIQSSNNDSEKEMLTELLNKEYK